MHLWDKTNLEPSDLEKTLNRELNCKLRSKGKPCGYMPISSIDKEEHESGAAHGMFPCKYCLNTYQSKADQVWHLKTVHEGVGENACMRCKKQFDSADEL